MVNCDDGNPLRSLDAQVVYKSVREDLIVLKAINGDFFDGANDDPPNLKQPHAGPQYGDCRPDLLSIVFQGRTSSFGGYR